MFYYEVALSGDLRGSKGIFTYSSDQNIKIGQCVVVPIKGKSANGFIVKKSSRPSYKTRSISNILEESIPLDVVNAYTKLVTIYPFSDQPLAQLFMPPKKMLKMDELTNSKITSPLPELNSEQQDVLNKYINSTENILLHGDTGSGKTRLYMHFADIAIKSGKSVVLLTPEIGLSKFLYDAVKPYFRQVFMYHSGLSNKERYSIWRHVNNSNQPVCIIGPRSALGLPLNNLGLIIVDESHDQSYRQENTPHINAKVLAGVFSITHGARVVYGSATPLVSDYYLAQKKSLPIYELKKIATDKGKNAKIKIISYAEKNEKSIGSLLKSSLLAISRSLENNGQSMVLINRRGTARHVSCGSCGHEERCKICEHLLTYHHDRFELRCHYCEKAYQVPQVCSSCGATEIQMRSMGAKAVVEELQKEFPGAVIGRYDTDSKKSDGLSANMDDIKSGKVQIIVGTQMIAKGLDLPNLKSLITFHGGAGSGFMSEERDFELIYQVLGRAMRGHQDTEIVIQTSDPKSKILKFATERDYKSFYDKELNDRKHFTYPPYCHMMIVHIRRKTIAGVQKTAKELISSIRKTHAHLSIGPPTPNRTEKIGQYIYWHVLIKAKKRSELVSLANLIGSGYDFELDPVDLP